MIVAKVVGTVVATRKDERLVSNKLLVARPIDPSGTPEGAYLVAVDTVDAGVGETVLIVSGSSARMASGMKDCPVDAAIVGFAVGTGFALIENTYYLRTLHSGGIMVWVVRGLGTAVMHGGMTAIFAIVAKTLFDRGRAAWWLPGLALVIVLHSLFNHFILPPVVSTLVLHVTLPAIILYVFWRSERATKRWLGTQMDVDAELLDIINSGSIATSRIGHYVETMKQQFSPAMVVDILCYLRLHVELAISAKGLLMMREAGLRRRCRRERGRSFRSCVTWRRPSARRDGWRSRRSCTPTRATCGRSI